MNAREARVRKIEARTAVPTGNKRGRAAGYATPAERHAKTLRLKALRGRLARVERRIEDGAVSVARGGRRLMRGEARRLRGRAVAVFVSSSADSGFAASAFIGAALLDFDRNDGRGRRIAPRTGVLRRRPRRRP